MGGVGRSLRNRSERQPDHGPVAVVGTSRALPSARKSRVFVVKRQGASGAAKTFRPRARAGPQSHLPAASEPDLLRAFVSGDLVHGLVQLFDELLARMEMSGVGPSAAAKLVHPFDRARGKVCPLVTLLVKEVNVPGRPAALVQQSFGKGLPNEMSLQRIVEVFDPRIVKRLGDLARCVWVVIETRHLNPDDTDADVRLWKILKHRFEHRTGAKHATRSRRREDGHKPSLVPVCIEAVF